MNILKLLTPARLIGNFGERAACKYLKRKGYKILKRNYVGLNKREIDIIARKDNVTAFVEVKTRSADYQSPNEPRPASAVTPEKQLGLITAAKCYIGYNRPNTRIRFDILEIYVKKQGRNREIQKINHLENAFNYNTALRR